MKHNIKKDLKKKKKTGQEKQYLRVGLLCVRAKCPSYYFILNKKTNQEFVCQQLFKVNII